MLKCIFCALSVLLIVFVTMGIFTSGTSKTGMHTPKDIQRMLGFMICAAILLVGVVSMGIFLLVKNKQYNDYIAEQELLTDGEDTIE